MSEFTYPWTFLLDTSVIVKWFKPDEEDAGRALEFKERLPRDEFQIAVADISLLELGNVLLSSGHLAAEVVRQAISDVAQTCQFQVRRFRPLYLRRAVELALECRLALYDAYLAALAQDESMIFVTADRRLFDAVRGRQQPVVQWLADWRLPAALEGEDGAVSGITRCVHCGKEEFRRVGLGATYGKDSEGVSWVTCGDCFTRSLKDQDYLRKRVEGAPPSQDWQATDDEQEIKRVMSEEGLRTRAAARTYERGWFDGYLRAVSAARAEHERDWLEIASSAGAGEGDDPA